MKNKTKLLHSDCGEHRLNEEIPAFFQLLINELSCAFWNIFLTNMISVWFILLTIFMILLKWTVKLFSWFCLMKCFRIPLAFILIKDNPYLVYKMYQRYWLKNKALVTIPVYFWSPHLLLMLFKFNCVYTSVDLRQHF